MFDLDGFLDASRACLAEADPRGAIRETLARALADPTAVADALRPGGAGITLLHRSDELTVAHVVWAPRMNLFAHDHRMWACIGIVTGQEDNRFFRRPERGDGLVGSGAKRLGPGDVTLLGAETIHAVANPLARPTAAVHVYGGDFVAQPRSQWVEPDLVEEPYDSDLVSRVFAEAEAAAPR